MKKLLTRSIIVAAAFAALLAPAEAQAGSNFQFKCPGGACTTVGGGPTVTSNLLYNFMVGTDGSYDFYAAGTDGGSFDFTIFSDALASNQVSTFHFAAGSNPNTLVMDNLFLNAGTYYVGATGSCEGPGKGCNVVLKPDFSTGGDMSTVPEPSTIILAASGLLGLAIFGRRRQQRQS